MENNKLKTNMLSGSMWDKILRFALPIAATGILQQLFSAADLAVVGRFTGSSGTAAQAAVGVNTPIVGLIVNLFTGMALGTNVVIAGAVGRGDESTIKKTVHTSVIFAIICGVLSSAVGQIFAVSLLESSNVPAEVLPMATAYLRIYLLGLPFILLYNFEAAILRAVGNTQISLYVLTISGVINVGLNFLFVAGFDMNVVGVAVATLMSNMISAILLFIYLLRSDLAIKLRIKELKIDKTAFVRILKIGLPAGVQSAVFSFANIIVQSAINSLDTVAIAASSAAFNVEIFAYYVFNAFGQACTTFVGQNSGASQPERCRKALKLSILEGAIGLFISACLILLFGRSILSVFNSDPMVIETGYLRLKYVFVAYIFSMFYENTGGYLRGYGISLTPSILTMLSVCGIRLTWVFFVFPLKPDFETILAVFPVSLATNAIFMFIALAIIRPSRKKKLVY